MRFEMRNDLPDFKALAVLGVISLAIIAYVIAGVVEGHADEPSTPVNQIMECSDYVMPPAITAADRALAVTARMVDEARQSEPEAAQAPDYDETVYEYQNYDSAAYSGSGGTYYAEYNELYNDNGPSRSMPGWYDGYLETYYNASAHYLASEWTVDDEGFYRDGDGRYVVGVDINDVNPDTGQQYQYGDVVQTGRGEGVVYDYGSGAHVHDFATTW